jgi:hypothetical protein
MAVLIEGISVVVRRPRIDALYPGGWKGYVSDCPNRTLCADPDLARIGFMDPADVQAFVNRLESLGFVFYRDNDAVDLVVVDQQEGPTTACSWLEFGHVSVEGNRLAVCRLAGSKDLTLVMPDGWTYEGSLSASFGFLPTEEAKRELRFLRHDNGVDVFLHLPTGREVYVGRTDEDVSDGEDS